MECAIVTDLSVLGYICTFILQFASRYHLLHGIGLTSAHLEQHIHLSDTQFLHLKWLFLLNICNLLLFIIHLPETCPSGKGLYLDVICIALVICMFDPKNISFTFSQNWLLLLLLFCAYWKICSFMDILWDMKTGSMMIEPSNLWPSIKETVLLSLIEWSDR